MLVDGKKGRERCWWESKEGSGEEGMERNKGKTKWKEKLQKTVGLRLTMSKDYCLHNSLGTRLVYTVSKL